MFVYGLACAALILAGLRYFGCAGSAAPAAAAASCRTCRNVGTGGFASIAEALAKARPGDTVEVSSRRISGAAPAQERRHPARPHARCADPARGSQC